MNLPYACMDEDRLLKRRGPRGITLIEMLIAMALTLLIMATVVTVFNLLGTGVAQSRAALEVGDRLRLTRNRLQDDLGSLTCPTIPWARPAAGVGYIEYTEGPRTDVDPTLLASVDLTPSRSALGDADDVLAFTIRRRDRPFVAQVDGTTVQSHVAEVVWFTTEAPNGLRTLHRRVILVAPSLDLSTATTDDAEFFQNVDISSRVVESGGGTLRRVANSLSDLTKRENRFGHVYRVPDPAPGSPNLMTTFPHSPGGSGYTAPPTVSLLGGGGNGAKAKAHIDPTAGVVTSIEVETPGSGYVTPPQVIITDPTNGSRAMASAQIANGSVSQIVVGPSMLSGPRQGEDVMLSNVLAFDVRAYDPGAPLYAYPVGATEGQSIVSPGDPGWIEANEANATPVGYGAYVDLGYVYDHTALSSPPPVTPFFNLASRADWASAAQFSENLPLRNTYDSWSFHYEHDGIDQDGDGMPDEGTNGIDDDGENGVDDPGERETSPPYPYPLRGIQIRIRVYEPDSRQIREVSVIQSFVPE